MAPRLSRPRLPPNRLSLLSASPAPPKPRPLRPKLLRQSSKPSRPSRFRQPVEPVVTQAQPRDEPRPVAVEPRRTRACCRTGRSARRRTRGDASCRAGSAPAPVEPWPPPRLPPPLRPRRLPSNPSSSRSNAVRQGPGPARRRQRRWPAVGGNRSGPPCANAAAYRRRARRPAWVVSARPCRLFRTSLWFGRNAPLSLALRKIYGQPDFCKRGGVGVSWACSNLFESVGARPRSMMRVAPGKPKSPSASRCWISCQVSCQAVEPFMSSRTRVAKPGSDCVKR